MYIQLLSLGWGCFHLRYSKMFNYKLYCLNCLPLPLQCLSTHPWWTSTFSTLQRPRSTSTKLLGCSLGRDPQRGLTLSGSAPSLRMDMNSSLSMAAGTHKLMGTVMATPDCTTVRTDMADAFRKQSMDRYCVESLWHTTVCTQSSKKIYENQCWNVLFCHIWHYASSPSPFLIPTVLNRKWLWFKICPGSTCSDHTGRLMFHWCQHHRHVKS